MLRFIKRTKQLNITDTLIIIVLYMFQKCVVHSIIKLSYFYIFTGFLRLEFLFDFTSMCDLDPKRFVMGHHAKNKCTYSIHQLQMF